MKLERLYNIFESQLIKTEAAFKIAVVLNQPSEKLQRRHRLEGCLSDAWQAYCLFSRGVSIRSSMGCTTSSGVIHAATIHPINWERCSYIAVCISTRRNVQPILVNSLLRKEPTWGDGGKISDILDALSPGNINTLKGYLAGGLAGPKHCQIIRNACAHNHRQNLKEVQNLSIYYIAHPVIHPVDSLTWRDPNTSSFAFLSWLDEMKIIAKGAVS